MKKPIFSVVFKDLGPILKRNFLSLVVIIIGGLSLLLIYLGDFRDGAFLGGVIVLNVFVGIIQEIRSRIALERLQATSAEIYKVSTGSNKYDRYAEEINVDDIVYLKLGDQVPVDGKVISSEGCECNEAILTGESRNISKSQGDNILAGSIIVAGTVELKADKIADESYLSTMTQGLKLYKKSLSPIQISILRFVQLMVIILGVLSLIILIRNSIAGESFKSAILQVASVAATIIPEGLLLASTAFFVYGAVRISKKKVLLQQINAIENLGRMSIVCIDKTGTLTENDPKYDELLVYSDNFTRGEFNVLLNTYLVSESAPTATTKSLQRIFSNKNNLEVSERLSFSSSRKYGAVKIKKDGSIIVVGASDNFTSHLTKKEKLWVKDRVEFYSDQAKRVLFVGTANKGKLNDLNSLKTVRVAGLIVMSNPLKSGVGKAIEYLQKRNVQIVVISGDNAKTVGAIADKAGIIRSQEIINGVDLDKLTDKELIQKIQKKSIFARILPNQKERIVTACQSANNLTAMVGDGANDALAIKKSDIGIAMFAGAPASRQIADAVLLDNSFTSIPKGIQLSDSLITTLEMIASLFFSRVWTGVLLVIGTIVLNMNYPFTPRNITLLNLFIVAFPLTLWSAWPRHRNRDISEPGFLARTLPFAVLNSLVITLLTLTSYFYATNTLGLNIEAAQMFTYISFLIMSVFTISIIPTALGVDKNIKQQVLIWIFYIFVAIIIIALLQISSLASFFNLEKLSINIAIKSITLGFIGIAVQQLFASLQIGNKFWLKLQKIKKLASIK